MHGRRDHVPLQGRVQVPCDVFPGKTTARPTQRIGENEGCRSYRLFELVALVRTQQPTGGDAYLRVRHSKHAAIEQVMDESAGKADGDERRYP
jgi:hypothetical protein